MSEKVERVYDVKRPTKNWVVIKERNEDPVGKPIFFKGEIYISQEAMSELDFPNSVEIIVRAIRE